MVNTFGEVEIFAMDSMANQNSMTLRVQVKVQRSLFYLDKRTFLLADPKEAKN